VNGTLFTNLIFQISDPASGNQEIFAQQAVDLLGGLYAVY
jgi:hypothetical protein